MQLARAPVCSTCRLWRVSAIKHAAPFTVRSMWRRLSTSWHTAAFCLRVYIYRWKSRPDSDRWGEVRSLLLDWCLSQTQISRKPSKQTTQPNKERNKNILMMAALPTQSQPEFVRVTQDPTVWQEGLWHNFQSFCSCDRAAGWCWVSEIHADWQQSAESVSQRRQQPSVVTKQAMLTRCRCWCS